MRCAGGAVRVSVAAAALLCGLLMAATLAMTAAEVAGAGGANRVVGGINVIEDLTEDYVLKAAAALVDSVNAELAAEDEAHPGFELKAVVSGKKQLVAGLLLELELEVASKTCAAAGADAAETCAAPAGSQRLLGKVLWQEWMEPKYTLSSWNMQ